MISCKGLKLLIALIFLSLLICLNPLPAFAQVFNPDFQVPLCPLSTPNCTKETQNKDGYYLRFQLTTTGYFIKSKLPPIGSSYTLIRQDELVYLGKDKPFFTAASKKRTTFFGAKDNPLIFLKSVWSDYIYWAAEGKNISPWSGEYSGTQLTKYCPYDDYTCRIASVGEFQNTINSWDVVFKGCSGDDFISCLKAKFQSKFPFDLFSSPITASQSCPKITFLEKDFDICFIYAFFKWFKYPIAIGLIVKMVQNI